MFLHEPTPGAAWMVERCSGDNFASMLSVFNMWFFSEMPNSRSCDGFSEHLQTVLFTMGGSCVESCLTPT